VAVDADTLPGAAPPPNSGSTEIGLDAQALTGMEPSVEPEEVLGDTPLSAIERLSTQSDLSGFTRRRDNLLTTAWAFSFAVLAALGVAGYTQRDSLMRQWPASKRVYVTLGLVPTENPAGDVKDREVKGAGRM